MTHGLRSALFALAIVTAIGTVASGLAWRELDRVMRHPLTLTRPVLLTIAPGTDLRSIARALETEGFVPHYLLAVLRARLDGVAHSLKAGTYEVRPGDNLTDLIARIAGGHTKVFHVTFIEGCRFEDMRRVLRTTPYIKQTLRDVDATAIAAALGVTEGSLEGIFFPSTYQYEAMTDDRAILLRAYRRMQEILARHWQARAAGLPYASPHDALIMASIVEKETGRGSERAEIAGVFRRRLEQGMKLQTDPTVIYGLGADFDGNLRRADLDRDTPYNTYTRGGLPATPIAMPGEAALVAVLHPAEGSALYFVAKGDGSHQFSDSLREHTAAVRRFQVKKDR